MSTYTATIRWQRDGQDFANNKYTRAHRWSFDGGLTVPASASPGIVPLPLSVAENVDPEEAFVAALSSCHMLFFLALAAENGIVVDDYTDEAVGFMGQTSDCRTAMLKVVLRPKAAYAHDASPTPEQVEKLHHRAHELCYIANSVKTEIVTEIVS